MSVVAGRRVVAARTFPFERGRIYRVREMRLRDGGWREQRPIVGRYEGQGVAFLVFVQANGEERYVQRTALLSVVDEVHVG